MSHLFVLRPWLRSPSQRSSPRRAARRPVASPSVSRAPRLRDYSFAGAASGSGDLSSMFWNPAVITMMPGWQSEGHASLIIPQVDINPLPSDPDLRARRLRRHRSGCGRTVELLLLPDQRPALGRSVSTAPYGLVTDPRQVWSGQLYSRSSRIFSLNVNPVVGFKVNDWLSVARRADRCSTSTSASRAPPSPYAGRPERHPRGRRLTASASRPASP